MKAKVNKNGCISCGLCVNMCPDVFAFGEDGKAESVVKEIPSAMEKGALEARDACPVSVIDIG